MLALLIWVLAVYGLVIAMLQIARYLSSRAAAYRKLTLVLIVQNGEAYMEGILRTVLYRAFLSKKEIRILVVDAESTDATPEIVDRMQEWDARVELMTIQNMSDQEVMSHIWKNAGLRSPLCLFDLRDWKHERKILHYLTRIVG